jgi:hypothetical protein
MRYGHRRVIPQVTAVDELFGTHKLCDVVYRHPPRDAEARTGEDTQGPHS